MELIKKLAATQWEKRPWKNGGGTTTQLAIYPENLSLNDDYFWRAALAESEKSGPYSSFSGYTRSVVPLAKSTIALRHGPSMDFKSLTPFEPYTFSGDAVTESKLEKPSIDFNVMVKRSWGSMHVHSVQVEVTQEYEFRTNSHFTLIYCAEGAFSLPNKKEWGPLRSRDTLLVQGPSGEPPLQFSLTTPHVLGRLILVELFKNG